MTPHFTIAELTASETALRRGLRNDPTLSDLRRLRALCEHILEPLRAEVGPLIVTSGYRSADLNRLVGGVPESAHRYGCAADVVPVRCSVEEAWRAVVRLGLPFDQAIWERRGERSEWLHVGIERPGEPTPRKQHFTIWR